MDDRTEEYGQAGGTRDSGEPRAVPEDAARAPAGPAPLGLGREATGEQRVDAALERLGAVDHLATDGHLAVYEDVHQGLRAALDALDAPQGPSAPPPARPDGPAGRAH